MSDVSDVTSEGLMTISVCHILRGTWGVLGCILDSLGGSETNNMLPFTEVY